MTARILRSGAFLAALALMAPLASATPFSFSTGSPDGLIATGSRPSSPGKIEIESADDFILGLPTNLTGGTFTGLLPVGATAADIAQVVVEIYRVFPIDSNEPPSGNVPSRTNSPSDVAFDSRDSSSGTLTFSASVLSDSFTAANSVLNGINKIPNQTTRGEGPVTGQEVLFTVHFTTPFSLPADHYFFIPQVQLASGDFFWLSAPKPTTPPFLPDLQSWIRNEDLAPDWLRVGQDIVGPSGDTPAPTFNAAFSVEGNAVPEPSTMLLVGAGLFLAGWKLRRRGA